MTARTAQYFSQQQPALHSAVAVARLTAMWALVESAMFGVLHALKIPLMGLVMAGTAVLLISLIAYFAQHPRDILKATLLVLMVKAIGSPHTPIVGYTAVAFQGGFAFLVYSLRRPGPWSTGLFAVVALLETALQKLILLAVVFGAPLWDAIDEWGGWILQRYFPSYVDAEFSLAMSLIGVYVGIYLVGGLLIGYIAAKLPARIAHERENIDIATEQQAMLARGEAATSLRTKPVRSRRAQTIKTVATWSIIAAVLAATVYFAQSELSAWQSAVVYLARTIAILAVWYFLVGPFLSKLVQRWLLNRSETHASDLHNILQALPQLRYMATEQLIQMRKHHSGLALYRRWIPRVLAICLTLDTDKASPTAQPGQLT